MSPLPGYEVNIVETAPTPSQLGNIGTLFASGKADTPGFGMVYSIDQFTSIFGDRQASAPYLWDGVQVYFREGGYRAYISAVGVDDDPSDIASAMDAFVPDYGPGTLCAFGETDPAVHLALASQTAYSRIALLDAPDDPDVQILTSAAKAVTDGSTLSGERFSAMFAPWDIVPGLIAGTTRTTPPSARVAGNLARNDALGWSPGDGAVAALGIASYAQQLSQPAWSDGDRTTLNESGVNISRMIFSTVRTYGWRSLADQITDNDWSMFNAARIIMAIKFDLSVMAENFVFSKLDSMAKVTAKFGGAISLVLLDYFNQGDLYGDTFDESCSVDTGPAVNTDQSFSEGRLMANVGVRTAGMAERVIINIAKVPMTEAVAVVSGTNGGSNGSGS